MRVSDIPVCPIMGVDVAAVDMDYTLDYVANNLDTLRGNYICVTNVHTVVTSYRDAEYAAVQNGSAFCTPDGKPLSVVGRKRGHEGMDRVAGPDLMGRVFADERFAERSHYFYGSTQETLDLLEQKLGEAYPGLKIAGMYSPPFRKLTEEERAADLARINASNADFLWVGLGAPKQERWMAANEGKVDALMIGVGAGFDYFAGNIKRAPMWMQKAGLEWLYRLMQDPKRLFSRYVTTNASFIYNAVLLGR